MHIRILVASLADAIHSGAQHTDCDNDPGPIATPVLLAAASTPLPPRDMSDTRLHPHHRARQTSVEVSRPLYPGQSRSNPLRFEDGGQAINKTLTRSVMQSTAALWGCKTDNQGSVIQVGHAVHRCALGMEDSR